MTLLHQAAQKAVEALKLTISARTAPNEWDLGVFETAIEKCEVVLRQVESALQHQEVPREPVAWVHKDALIYHLKEPGGWAHAHSERVPGTYDLPLYASPSTTRQQEVGTWLLYEHEDGRHAVAPTAEAATFAHGDPAWHRVGPVEVASESLPYRSAAGDTLASIAQAELRDMNRWPEILTLNTHVLDGAAGPASKPRAGTLLTLPSPSTARQQEVGSEAAFCPCSFCDSADACRERGCADAAYGREVAGRRAARGGHAGDTERVRCVSCEWRGLVADCAGFEQCDCPMCLAPVTDCPEAAPSTPENADGGPHG